MQHDVHHRERRVQRTGDRYREGAGFAGWHGGIADSYRDTSNYLHLAGGQFASHPGKHPDEHVGDGPENNYVPHIVNITDPGRDHEITCGIEDFELVTEQYWVLSDNLNDVLATTTQKARDWDPWHREVTSPAVWTRLWGNGKVFVATPGHSVDVLQAWGRATGRRRVSRLVTTRE